MKKYIVPLSVSISLIAIFNVLVFTLLSTFTKNFWCGYAFIMLSLILIPISVILRVSSKKGSEVSGFPIVTLSVYYFIIEAIMGSLLMYWSISFIAVLLPQLLLFLIFMPLYVTAISKLY